MEKKIIFFVLVIAVTALKAQATFRKSGGFLSGGGGLPLFNGIGYGLLPPPIHLVEHIPVYQHVTVPVHFPVYHKVPVHVHHTKYVHVPSPAYGPGYKPAYGPAYGPGYGPVY